MAYFITDEDSTKGRDPNINIFNGIHNIKGKMSVNILVSNYINKHNKTSKGKYIGCLELTIEGSMTDVIHTQGQLNIHSTNSITLQRMMAEQVQPDIFHPPCHKLKPNIESKHDVLLKGYASQFAKDETSIETTPLTEWSLIWAPLTQYPRHHTWLPWRITNGWKTKLRNFLQQKSYTAVGPVGQCQL